MADQPQPLPQRANLEHLRKQAKQKLVLLRHNETGAKLSDAQFALAQQYGFKSWRALKAHVDRARDAAPV
jgi:hypothetical protein